ncbi:MAG: Acryloyl-CoA reductase electron transfer subunit gamma [Candidatus Aminicenantes bacterium ADurb.Bin508]|nr:MAG: Acryloyl-CoA reductase electron transfer subunit gamma [Candidatus Aminicenantes bacterium ADurb.Bin508]HNX40911.1 electron transfer flavoprotein subunit beta/FixA family protein [Candidatus Aminicenantes bacterium]
MKNIFVCVKQVPDTTEVKWDTEKGTLKREGVASILNPFDLYALEEALRIKDKDPEVRVIALTMGPKQSQEILKECVSLGADEGILLSDALFAGSDTLATSYALSRAILHRGDPWIVFAGKQAIDGDTAQVGPGIATWLGLPQATYVRKVESLEEGKAVVERLTEEGYERVEISLPALFTVVKEINTPRLPSLRGKMKAKSFQPLLWSAQEVGAEEERVGLRGSPTQVKRVFSPPQKEGEGERVEGKPEVLAHRLSTLLKEWKVL